MGKRNRIVVAKQMPFGDMSRGRKIQKLASVSADIAATVNRIGRGLSRLTDVANWVSALTAELEERLDLGRGELAQAVADRVVLEREKTQADADRMQQTDDFSLAESMGARILLSVDYPVEGGKSEEGGNGNTTTEEGATAEEGAAEAGRDQNAGT